MTTAERFFKVLKERRLTQKEVCAAIGVNASTMSMWGKSVNGEIPAQYIAPISKYLGIDPSDLIVGVEDEATEPELAGDQTTDDVTISITLPDTISSRILSTLREKRITQKELCLSIGVLQGTFCTWLKNNSESIPSQYVVPIAEYLGVDPLWLLTGDAELDPIIQNVPDEDHDGAAYFLIDDEAQLVDAYRRLDWEGRAIVKNALVLEARRLKGDVPGEACSSNVG